MDKETFDLVKEKIDWHIYYTRKYRHYSNNLNIDASDFYDELNDIDTGYYEVIEKVYQYKLRQIMNEGQPQLNNDIMFFFKYIELFNDQDERYTDSCGEYERCNRIYFNYCYHCEDCDCERCRNRYSDDEYDNENDDFCYQKCDDKCKCERCNIRLNINSRLAINHREYDIYNELEEMGCKCIDDGICRVCWDDFCYHVRRNDRYQWYINDMFKMFEKKILDFKNI